MRDEDKTKDQLIQELEMLRKQASVPVNIFEKVSDGIVVWGFEGNLLEANPAFCNMLGYTRVEIIELSVGDIVCPDKKREINNFFQSNKDLGRIDLYESIAIRKDGSSLPIEMSASTFAYLNQPAILSIVRDITERKRMEEAFRTVERKYTNILEDIEEGYYELDLEGNFTFCNEAIGKINLYSMDELKGMNNKQYLTPESRKGLINLGFEVAKTGCPGTLEAAIIRKDGSERFVESTLALLLDDRGKHIGYRGVVRDIHERKVAEKELESLKTILSSTINSMPSVIVGIDLEKKVTQWNKEAEKVTGLSSQQVLGKTLVDVFPQLTNQMKKVEQALQNGQILADEKISFINEKGTQFLDVTIFPLTFHEQDRLPVEGAVIRVDDITERVRLEELMVQTEKMISVGGLAAGAAHEINNPLSGIIQGVQVIQNRLSSELEKNRQVAKDCGVTMEQIYNYLDKRQVLEFLQDIRESGNRAAKIVNNMLQFGRGGTAEKEPIPLPELINQTVELASNDYELKKQYDFRNIEIIREFDPECLEVFCIKTEIEQVLLNLLNNAAHAVYRQSSQIQNRTPKITLRTRKVRERVQIEVEDNGPGMEESICKRIFEPFFTTKEVGQGIGLGLSVSYFMITKNHQGTLAIESTLGEGTKFIINLP